MSTFMNTDNKKDIIGKHIFFIHVISIIICVVFCGCSKGKKNAGSVKIGSVPDQFKGTFILDYTDDSRGLLYVLGKNGDNWIINYGVVSFDPSTKNLHGASDYINAFAQGWNYDDKHKTLVLDFGYEDIVNYDNNNFYRVGNHNWKFTKLSDDYISAKEYAKEMLVEDGYTIDKYNRKDFHYWSIDLESYFHPIQDGTFVKEGDTSHKLIISNAKPYGDKTYGTFLWRPKVTLKVGNDNIFEEIDISSSEDDYLSPFFTIKNIDEIASAVGAFNGHAAHFTWTDYNTIDVSEIDIRKDLNGRYVKEGQPFEPGICEEIQENTSEFLKDIGVPDTGAEDDDTMDTPENNAKERTETNNDDESIDKNNYNNNDYYDEPEDYDDPEEVISNDTEIYDNELYTADELSEMALDYVEYKTGYRPHWVNADYDGDDKCQIWLYDDNGENTSTVANYLVSLYDATGIDMFTDEKIDLKEAGSGTYDDVRAGVDSKSAEYILPDSDKKYYSADDLSGFSKEDLRLARNEIYARHGYIFKDGGMQSYFGLQSWYTPTTNDVPDTELNDFEKANLGLIKEIEKR